MAGPSYWHEVGQDHSTNRSDGLSGSCHEERPALSSCSSSPNETEPTMLSGAKKTGTSSAGSSPRSPHRTFVPPPPRSEQKVFRQKDPSIVPAAPYLHVSWFFDVVCEDVPLLRSACPDAAVGGWRSILPDPEWGTFPHGRLSHSFELNWGRHKVRKDVTFGEYARSLEASAKNTNAPGDNSGGGGGGGITTTLGNYYDFAFRTDNTTLGNLTHPSTLAVLLVLVLLVRALKRLLLPRFASLGRRLGRSAHGPGWEDGNADRVEKFGEYVWRLLFHSSLSAYGAWYSWDKPWWDDARGGAQLLFEGHSHHALGPGMAWYYLVQAAYNVDALVSLLELSFALRWRNPLRRGGWALGLPPGDGAADGVRTPLLGVGWDGVRTPIFEVGRDGLRTLLLEVGWSPTVRGDFREMLVHHLVTNVLVFGSSAFGSTRAGSVVFLLHDLSDVPIDLSKLANFVKWKAATCVCFFTMVAVWVATRLYLFPLMVVRTALVDMRGHLVERGTLDPAAYDAVIPFSTVSLLSLVLLHVTWFTILLRIGWTLVSKGETHDYSEFRKGEGSRKDR